MHDHLTSDLIGHDMDIHVMNAKEIDNFFNDNRQIVISLLITALAEIHANADMFGGLNSISFKMKFKRINQRGKQILKLIKGEL